MTNIHIHFSLRSSVLSAVCIVSLSALPTTAFAYLDPGTGSYVLQVALGTLFAASFAARQYWQGIRGGMRKLLVKLHVRK